MKTGNFSFVLVTSQEFEDMIWTLQILDPNEKKEKDLYGLGFIYVKKEQNN